MLNIQGQSRALAHLQRALNSSRLAHTWIFAGPPGVGKYKTALELAKTVLCDHPTTAANGDRLALLPADFPLRLPCHACESCRAVDMGSHPDVHIIRKENNRLYDATGKSKSTNISSRVIRAEITGGTSDGVDYEPKAWRKSILGKGKCFLVDEAELMDVHGQNLLLKTLEEPPPATFLILITTAPNQLLSTIRSRAQMVQFAALPADVIVPALVGRGLSAKDAGLLARLSRGSLGLALKWAGDMAVIEQKNAAQTAKKAKSGDEDEATKFTAGGILAWTAQLAAVLDGLVIGEAGGSDVYDLLMAYAAEYAALELLRDPLTSESEARRNGIALLMGIAAEWFADRMRHGLGAAYATPLPGQTGALDYGLVPKLIASARTAEAQVEQNVNDKILLAATTTEWEKLLRAG